MDTIWAEYGEAVTVNFDLWELDDTDLQVGAVFASGDVKVMKDEGAEANTTNGFTDEGTGYSITLTLAELTAARLMLYIVDQTGPKEWRDRVIRILTYGHPSAHDPRGVVAKGTAQAGSTVSSVILDAGETLTTDDEANGTIIEIYAGTGAGQRRVITDYVFSTNTATVEPALQTAPDATSKYRRLGTPPTNIVADLGAVRTKTDQLTFSHAGQVDAAVKRINATTVVGDGSAGDLWRP
jgi:hypothetical protein